jgi:hypothetical protein
MKSINWYLPQSIPPQIELFFDSLHWDEKFQWSSALAQRALDERSMEIADSPTVNLDGVEIN